MSKGGLQGEGSDESPRNPRTAFHRAVEIVLEDLAALVAALASESAGSALLLLKEVLASPASFERRDLWYAVKQAVGRLRSSLSTAHEIRKAHRGLGRIFCRGIDIDRAWAGIAPSSHHDVVTGAASALLEQPKPSDTIAQQVLDSCGDREAWEQLKTNLRHEYRLVMSLPSEEVDHPASATTQAAPSPTSPVLPPQQLAAGTRPPTDEDAERAFDLLGHYKGFVCDAREREPEHAKMVESATGQLEDVLRRWLPVAHGADDPLINGILAILGDRDAAAALLRDADLWQARHQCLQRNAAAATQGLSPADTIAACLRDIKHWRRLLPHIFRRGDGTCYVHESDRRVATYLGHYWSADLENRPSMLGASYFLASSCDVVVAVAAHDFGMRAEARPAIRLAQRLRETPEWSRVDAFDAVKVIEEQLGLAREVEELLTELRLVIAPTRTRSPKRRTSSKRPSRGRKKDGRRTVVSRDGVASAGWMPNAHQRLVLELLERDGQLRTGVLWDRIFPKHADKRAHQYAMKDLVAQGRVLTHGKGRATEYCLP